MFFMIQLYVNQVARATADFTSVNLKNYNFVFVYNT